MEKENDVEELKMETWTVVVQYTTNIRILEGCADPKQFATDKMQEEYPDLKILKVCLGKFSAIEPPT